MTWVLDLDGVIWLAGKPVPRAAGAVKALRGRGTDVVFLTNNSGPTLAELVSMLAVAGVEADASELVTSAQAAASLLRRGQRAAVVGGAGISEALAQRGVEVVPAASRPDAVVVGRSVELDYAELASAATAVRAGADFVATNTDATYPTSSGPEPGAGAVVAFLQVASGLAPRVAGKPHPAVAELVRQRCGRPEVVVGDRADTDGAFAGLVGSRFALVLTGVTRREDLPVTPEPAVVGADLAEVVERLA